MSIGFVAALAGAGFVSIPAAFMTRLGIDRLLIQRGLAKRLESNLVTIVDLGHAAPP